MADLYAHLHLLRRLLTSSAWLAPPDFHAIAKQTLRSKYTAAVSAAPAPNVLPRKAKTSRADGGAAETSALIRAAFTAALHTLPCTVELCHSIIKEFTSARQCTANLDLPQYTG